jgi:hypothetical protein
VAAGRSKGLTQQLLTFAKGGDPLLKTASLQGISNDPVLAHYRDYGFLAAIAKPFCLDELAAVLKLC